MSVRAFWWAPSKSARVLKVEAQGSAASWSRLFASSGRTLHNFGDDLTPLLLKHILHEPVRWAPPERADIVAVGSVLELYAERGSGALIWGTGARGGGAANVGHVLREKLGTVAAVRGPLTRDFLGLPETTVLGDPGLLSASSLGLTKQERAVTPSLLPHYRVWQTVSNRDAIATLQGQGFQIIQPTLRPEAVAEAIAKSEFLVTSSLHGVIVAHSLGVPVVLTTFDDALSGEKPFKYLDYFASIGREPTWTSAQNLVRGPALNSALERAHSETALIKATCESLVPPLIESLRSVLQ